MGSVLILVLLALMVAPKGALACGHITTWAESDASFFGITPEDVTVVNEPKKSVVSDRQITFFSLTTGAWNVSGQATWRLNVYISSYLTAADAEADFPLLKPVIPEWDFIENGPSFLTYYQRIVNEKFGLMGMRQSCIVSISGWGATKDLNVEYLRSQFIALFDKARTLIDSKCDLVNHPPEIRMTPQPGKGYPLEFNILKGEGFQIEIHDENGIKGADGSWKLDWSKFRVFDDIFDETGHFVQTISSENLLYGWNEEGKDLIISIRPDPKKLMSEHNVFNIQSNGIHQIVLAICDTDGLCGSGTYNVFFGPVIAVTEPQIFGSSGKYILVHGLLGGNTGQVGGYKMYLALYNQSKDTFWTYTYTVANGAVAWHKNILEPVLEANETSDGLFFQSGSMGNFGGYWGVYYAKYVDLTGLTDDEVLASQLFVGILDTTTNQWSMDWGPIDP